MKFLYTAYGLWPSITILQDDRAIARISQNGFVEFMIIYTDEAAAQILCEFLDVDEVEYERLENSRFFFRANITPAQWACLKLKSEPV